MTILLINKDAYIRSLLCQGFTEKNILSLSSDQLRHIFDDLYQAWILGREKLGSSTVDKTAAILWAALHSHEVRAEFSKHEIKCHPSIISIFVRFLITANIYEPLQDISHIKKDIKALITKSDHHHGRLNNIEE